MTYTPVYCRPPNEIIRYKTQYFDDNYGHTGITRIAIYLDKNKKQCEMIAQIIWD